ncbi:MAG TPA: DNA polymerase III subunit gamma/tau [Candidatus Limnocylindria bacterium]|nr:DNA polymerase III subunit gamma/tau [Candidatus Limnocylindria bacterium]
MSQTSAHQALYRRWRAQTFSEIVGQEATVAALRNAARTGRVAHALLFVGPRGTGKTSMARIVAKALNCPNLRDGEPDDTCPSCVAIREGTALDVAELDAASNNRVDDMRELLPRISTAPSDLRRKVFIIDEVQRIKEGWDVLLKTLEEPPDHVAFIFCTTDAGQIRPAVLSRVQRFDFRRLAVGQIAGKLRRILAEAGREADDDAVELIAGLAAGGMRDAESMLDQLMSGGAERLTADGVRELLGLADAESVTRFITALARGDALAGMTTLDELEDRGRDLRAFLDQILEALRAGIVARLADRSAAGPVDISRLAAVGRRLAAIDPARMGPGGLRFQLELALLDAAPVESAAAPARSALAATGPSTAGRESAVGPVHSVAAPRVAAPRRPTAASPEPSDSPPSTVSRGLDSAMPPAATSSPPAATPPLGEPSPAGRPGPVGGSEVSPQLAELHGHWTSIVADLSQQPAVKPLILACRPIAVDDHAITLGFPEHQSFLKDALERRRTAVEAGIASRLGRPVNVRFVATNVELLPPLPEDAESARLLVEAKRIFADDLVDVGEVS